jgi:ABC-type branched-subunit amino acid transport system permease subunit
MLLPLVTAGSPYVTVLAIDLLIAALFAASLHFIMGPGGMHSFGHAAYFGLGAYGAALLVRSVGLPMEGALIVAPLVAALGAWCSAGSASGSRACTWPCSRWPSRRSPGPSSSSGTASPAAATASPASGRRRGWPIAAATTTSRCCWWRPACCWLRRALFSPFGYALRASRDSALRADAIGIDVRHMQWAAFVIVGLFAGLAGALFAFSKGSISPDSLHVGRSVDGLVMVLLGGIQTLSGPLVGAVTFTWLHDTVARNTDYWRAMLGGVILLLVLLFPMGIAGARATCYQRCAPAAIGSTGMTLLQVRGTSASRSAACGRRRHRLRPGRRRTAGPHRPQRRRQVHHLQHGQRPAAARRRLHPARRPRAGGPEAAPDLAHGRQPHLPDRRDLRVAHRGRERADGAAVADGKLFSLWRRRPRTAATTRWRCWPRSAWPNRPTARAASSPTATSSASNWPSPWPTSPSCC